MYIDANLKKIINQTFFSSPTGLRKFEIINVIPNKAYVKIMSMRQHTITSLNSFSFNIETSELELGLGLKFSQKLSPTYIMSEKINFFKYESLVLQKQ